MIDSTTSNRALGFLVWFRKFYKGQTDETYKKMAENYPHANYSTIRVYLLELERNGYVTIENKGKYSQKFIVNEEKYMEAFV